MSSRCIRILLCLSLFAIPGFAQFRAAVQGTITDQTGGTVAGAAVTLINNETRQEFHTTSSGEGFYRFSGLPPGRYTINAAAQGFQTQRLENLLVNAEEVQGQNLTLQAGATTQSITVSADTIPTVQTENADVAKTLTTEEIQRLPQLGRDPYELLRLTPGVIMDGARNGGGGYVNLPNSTGPGGSNNSIFQTENQVPISANGQRLSSNNFEVDGVSVNSLSYGGAAVITPNQESVKQVRTSANNYAAEYGRNSGAQINVISQNGTGQLHGSGVFKYNDPNFNAYNKFGGIGLPAVRVNQLYRQYAASIGGPILQNRLFFFFSYEGLKNNSTSYANAYVETPEFRQALIAARPNSLIAQVLSAPGTAPRVISTSAITCAQAGFAANACRQAGPNALNIGSFAGSTGVYTTPGGGGLGTLPEVAYAQLAVPSQVTGNQYNGRLDYQHGNDTLAVSTYQTFLDSLGADAGGRSRPNQDVRFKPWNSLYTLIYNRVFSPTTFNEFRVNFTRFADNQVTDSASTNYGLPRIEVESLPFDRIRFGPNRAETSPAIFAQNTYELRDNFTAILGQHALRVGGLYRLEQDNNNLLGGGRPLYSFQGLFNLANETPVFEAINADPVTGASASGQRYFRTKTFGEYLQDDWKVRPGLSVNIGLRWEYFTPLSDTRGELTNIVWGSEGLKNSRIVPVNQISKPQYNNWGPRFGLAWSVRPKLVFRTGFGIYYDRLPNVLTSNTRGNPPNFARYNICCGTTGSPFANGQIRFAVGANNSPNSFPVNPVLAQGIDPATGGPRGASTEIWGAFGDTRNTMAYIYSADLQYELPARMVAVLGYQGSVDHHLTRLVNENFLYPNNPAFYAVYIPQQDVNSSYNALVASLNRSLANGVQFGVNYRWAKSIDNLSYGGPGAVTNQTYPQNDRTERGPSDFDVRHNVVASALWELPFAGHSRGFLKTVLGGFEINPIFQFHTGFPWTPKSGQSVSTPGGPTLAPTRPVVYLGGAGTDTSNDTFLKPGGNFPGGGAKYFVYNVSGPPGIGRNVFRGPNYMSTDVSLIKNFHIPFFRPDQRNGLEFRANLYNVFNQLNLAPFQFFDASTFVDNGNFGRATAGLAGRVLEFQARLFF